MTKKKIGIIAAPPGVFLDKHEKLAVDFLAVNLGYDITFLVPDRRVGAKTPDINMNGILWEIKSPTGKSSRTIENNLREAILQSSNIILDLRRMDGRVPTHKHIRETEKQFRLAKKIKQLIVITREDERIDFSR